MVVYLVSYEVKTSVFELLSGSDLMGPDHSVGRTYRPRVPISLFYPGGSDRTWADGQTLGLGQSHILVCLGFVPKASMTDLTYFRINIIAVSSAKIVKSISPNSHSHQPPGVVLYSTYKRVKLDNPM